MEKLKVGICGYGGLGHAHAGNLAKMDDIEVVAVCDKRKEQLAAKDVSLNIDAGKNELDISKCRTYTNFKAMLEKEKLDVLVAALPSDLHAKYAIMAMDNGINVFSEKPMALNVKQCEAMIAARDKNKVQLQVGQCLRFWPEYRILKKAIDEKTYGKLNAITMTRIAGYCGWASDNWFNDHKRSGGAILDLHMHDVDWAVYALGMPQAITAVGTVGNSGGIDDVTASYVYDGFNVVIKGGWKYCGFCMSFQALFEDAAMDFGVHPNPALRVRTREGKEDILATDGSSAYYNEMRYFFECVRGQHANEICAAESTRESIRMVELERKAIKSCKWIKL